LIWQGTSTGKFSVRSANHMEKERQGNLKGEGSGNIVNNGFWKALWRMKVPNTVKVFLWRACHNLLPTKKKLMRKGIISTPSCPICEMDIEDTEHILWHCPSAMDVWGACGKIFQKRCNEKIAFELIVRARNVWKMFTEGV
jgi:hypothetical protein